MKYPSFTGTEPCTNIGPEMYTGDLKAGSVVEGKKTLREACMSCPMYMPCYQWALHHEAEDHGFWAGLTGNERRLERKRLNIILVDPIGVFNNGIGDRRLSNAAKNNGSKTDRQSA